jgi:hypothetical protein
MHSQLVARIKDLQNEKKRKNAAISEAKNALKAAKAAEAEVKTGLGKKISPFLNLLKNCFKNFVFRSHITMAENTMVTQR